MTPYVTQQEKNALLLPLMQAITARLNAYATAGRVQMWKLEAQPKDDPSQYFKITAGEATLWLHKTDYVKDDRITIDGILPRGRDGQYVTVYSKGADGSGWNKEHIESITVAMSRGVDTIVKEIQRRFLPEYLRILALALDKIAKDEAYENARYAHLLTLARELGEVLTVDKSEYNREPKEKRTSFTSYRGAGCSGVRVEVKACDSTVDLKIENLTMEQAQEILHILPKKVKD